MLEMFKSHKWKVIAAFISLVAVIAFLHVYLGTSPNERSSEVQAISAMFQAIGSVVALGMVLWLSNHERQIALQDKRQSALAIAESLAEFADEIKQLVDASRHEHMANPSIYNHFHIDIVTGYANTLKQIPLHELGSSSAVRSILTLSIHAELFGQTTQAYMNGVHRAKIFNWKGVGDLPVEQRNELIQNRFIILCNHVSQQVAAIQEQTSVLRRELAVQ